MKSLRSTKLNTWMIDFLSVFGASWCAWWWNTREAMPTTSVLEEWVSFSISWLIGFKVWLFVDWLRPRSTLGLNCIHAFTKGFWGASGNDLKGFILQHLCSEMDGERGPAILKLFTAHPFPLFDGGKLIRNLEKLDFLRTSFKDARDQSHQMHPDNFSLGFKAPNLVSIRWST